MNSWTIAIGALLFLTGGCSITTSYVTQDRLAHVPRMTCDQLVRNGPPADGQVIVTDLKPCREVVGTRYDDSLDSYVPAYRADLNQQPEPRDLAFLLQVWDDDANRRLLNEPNPGEFSCWGNRRARVVEVCRGPGQIEKWVKDGIEKKYPGIRFAQLTVLTIGHGSTPTPERVQSAWRYGIGELLIGTALLSWGAFRSRRRLGAEFLPPAGERRVQPASLR